jgi:hypothetical protein
MECESRIKIKHLEERKKPLRDVGVDRRIM